ncbi:protein-disulfide reductase DsbD domain-containing protein [Cyclobacterium qasimii]|uniref:Cytochrome c-type biogenesis protein DsbD, protein-disulfide reductase n=1 Tax=Cyclobacterium qasimii M12-11B TaxID=641524 RepID=S7VN74_9BACT|nr:protein-disulfide reductase DsbD domain-containing protein [Cyclobacterium qasimii]EPR71431.1 Cytochrome c-type biogenesis protein DsbD, protein-disulfide reductase [Cyclobacterium qasimii M12-11B]
MKDTEDVKEVSTGMALNLTGNTPKILEPVKWSTSVEKINDTELILVSTATIDKGWKLYAQNIEEGGPIPTSFDYTLKDGVELVGSTNEEKGEESIDKVFDMKIKYFKDKAEFRQKLKFQTQQFLHSFLRLALCLAMTHNVQLQLMSI